MDLESYVSQEFKEYFSDVVAQLEFKDIVRELPHGEETVETTADVLRKEGVEIGRSEGEIKASQNNLITVAQAKFGILPPEIIDQIRSIQTLETLQSLLTQAVIVNNAQEFIREIEGVSK